jgi:hypothetical protein
MRLCKSLANAALATVVAGLVSSVANVSHAAILNGGFEDPIIADQYPTVSEPYTVPPSYVYPGPSTPVTLDSWTYSGGAGLIDGTQPGAFEPSSQVTGFGGNQFAFVQGNGTLSQSFSATPGLATISWLEAGRPDTGCCNGDQSYTVDVDGTIGTYSTFSGQNFTLETLSVVLGANNTITFQGLATTDETAFIDNVSATPLPATWTMMLIGLAGLGFVSYRRRRQHAGLSAACVVG